MERRVVIRGAAAVLVLLVAACLPASAQETPLRGVEPPAIQPDQHAPATASPVIKTLPETLADAVGTWDMSLDGSNRRCELSLSGESGPDGRLLRFPAGCRRALPVLTEASGWLFANKGIRIVDRNLRSLVVFSPRPDQGSLVGTAESGGTYSLVPLQTLAMLPPSPAPSPEEAPAAIPAPGEPQAAPDSPPTVISDVAPTRGIPGSQPVLRADVIARRDATARQGPSPTTQADRSEPAPIGTYALDRFGEKDVCRIALESRPASARAEREPLKDLSPARILPGCRDGGIATFDPISWRYASGHLTLKARRGHAINLVAMGDGRWRRDPDTGTTLILRKVEP